MLYDRSDLLRFSVGTSRPPHQVFREHPGVVERIFNDRKSVLGYDFQVAFLVQKIGTSENSEPVEQLSS